MSAVGYDVLLDRSTGDLPVVTRLTTGIEVLAQRIYLRLTRYRGEWFLDTTSGLPLLEWLLVKPPPLDEMAARIRALVSTCPGVVRIRDFSISFDEQTRVVSCRFEVVGEAGAFGVTVYPVGTVRGNVNNFAAQVALGTIVPA